MSTDEAWAHLPNAKHITRLLADVKARPKVWKAAWGAGRAVTQMETRLAARAAARAAAVTVLRDVIQDFALWVAVWDPARDAVCALIAWDDSARMLDMPYHALRTLIDIAEGDVKH